MGETEENNPKKLRNPSVSFCVANIASGIARGRDLSPTTTTTTAAASLKRGDFSHAGLVNRRVHISLMKLDIRANWQLTSVTWPYRWLRCSLWGHLLDDGVPQGGAQRKYTGQLGSTYACSLHLCNLIWTIHFVDNWQLSRQGVRWPESHDRAQV